MREELGGVEGSLMMILQWVAMLKKHPIQYSFERGCEMGSEKAENYSE